MATKFNITEFLSENRNQVLEAYELLTKEVWFSGISKKDFGLRVMRNLSLNAKSEKTASKILSGIISRIVDEECEIEVLFDRDATGMQQSRKISLKTSLHAFFINKRFKAKDISDAVKYNGFETIKKWIYETIRIAEITA